MLGKAETTTVGRESVDPTTVTYKVKKISGEDGIKHDKSKRKVIRQKLDEFPDAMSKRNGDKRSVRSTGKSSNVKSAPKGNS